MNHKEWVQQKLNAQYVLNDHWHKGRVTPEERESCGACHANGYRAGKYHFVNYAGWARLWVQAGKLIEKKYFYAFLAELASDNRAYANCLRQDILDYGLNLPDGEESMKFKATVNVILGIYDYE